MTAADPHPPHLRPATAEVFGTLPDGRAVHRYRLGRAPGLELDVLDLGATVQRLVVTGGDQRRRNAHNVAGPHRRGKRGHQGAEGRHTVIPLSACLPPQ